MTTGVKPQIRKEQISYAIKILVRVVVDPKPVLGTLEVHTSRATCSHQSTPRYSFGSGVTMELQG